MGKKVIKGHTSRKPPEPAESHAVVDDWMQGVMPGIRPVVERIDAIIRKELRGLQYAIKWNKAHYGLPGKGWIIELAAYHVSANVVFYAGAGFEPPPPEGEGSRYVKVHSVAEADTPELRAWIRQAAEAKGWA